MPDHAPACPAAWTGVGKIVRRWRWRSLGLEIVVDTHEPLWSLGQFVIAIVRVVAAGSRARFIAMNRLQQVIDCVFPFDKVVDAFHYYETTRPFGQK